MGFVENIDEYSISPRRSSAKRNEYSQNVKTNFSPIRKIGLTGNINMQGYSSNRLSFLSQSPTRYDEIQSSSGRKNTYDLNMISPFQNSMSSDLEPQQDDEQLRLKK